MPALAETPPTPLSDRLAADTRRQALGDAGLARIPQMLVLLDRNPLSPTYGCFDRNYWHYRITDFPSGMAQEFAWPLALAYDLDIPGNPWHGEPALVRWVEAALGFAVKSAHADGSCDDYYPNERAVGAAAFSLIGMIEAAAIIGRAPEGFDGLVERRGAWLAGRRESGRLANHEALTALALLLADAHLGQDRLLSGACERLERALSWQHVEGWFQEYEGADGGYQSLTLWALGRAQALLPMDHPKAAEMAGRLTLAMAHGLTFSAELVHPDGSYGGETNSRNTYNYFPQAFELLGAQHPLALEIANSLADGLLAGRQHVEIDDHILGHHAWGYLLAWRDFAHERPADGLAPAPGRRHFPGAGLIIERRDNSRLIVALKKGGSYRWFGRTAEGAWHCVSDTGLSLQTKSGETWVSHLIDDYETSFEAEEITVSGRQGKAKQSLMSPLKMLVLRLAMLTLGRFAPDLVRRLLQAILITGKKDAPARFERRFQWRERAWEVEDQVWAEAWPEIAEALIDPAQTSIYVAMSRTFQDAQLAAPIRLSDGLAALEAGQPLRHRRRLSVEAS